jgi:hypothetical protein
VLGLDEITEPTDVVGLIGCFGLWATDDVAEEKDSLGFF